MDKKLIVIICLVVALAVVSWIAFKPSPVLDNTIIQNRLKVLERSNDSLNTGIIAEKIKQKTFQIKIDSLQNLKPKIKYIYVTKDNEINNASVNYVINDFNNVFANGGIK